MGDLQHFCLRWNNYQNSITTAFENLRDDEDFIDVTLACDGKTLKAHRVVLSACSPYFRELLKSTPCKHPVIVLQDVVFDDLHALVEFIYHGEVNVHQRNLTSFLKTAEVLKVSGLTQQNAAATPILTASPFSEHSNENISTRFTTRPPSAPPDKESSFPQPFFNSSLLRANHSSEDRNSPRALQQQTKPRRHIRSPTPIRSSYMSRDDSPISLKRAKSADNPSPSLIGSSINISPATILHDELMPGRTRRNSCDDSSSSRRNSPNTFSNDNYDENHNDEDSVTHQGDREDNDEPPVDFSTNAIKKYLNQPGQYPPSKSLSPRNLSMKIEPMDLVSNHNNNNDNSNNNNNNNNGSSSNNNSNNNNNMNSGSSTGSNNNNENDNDNNNFNDDDSNQSEDRLSDQSLLPTNPYPPALLDHEDAFGGHRNYIDSKLFAAAGASFSFNMAAAAALAADSIAGFNHHQSHTNVAANAVLDGLGGSSQGRSFNGSMVCADWMELERRGGKQGQIAIGGGQQQHGCFICGKKLSTRLTLKRHIEQQHHQPLHSSVCTVCHKVFRTLNSLNNHKSIYHRKPKWSTNSPTINSSTVSPTINLSTTISPTINLSTTSPTINS